MLFPSTGCLHTDGTHHRYGGWGVPKVEQRLASNTHSSSGSWVLPLWNQEYSKKNGGQACDAPRHEYLIWSQGTGTNGQPHKYYHTPTDFSYYVIIQQTFHSCLSLNTIKR